jgi:hypothetical protein
VFGGIGFDLGSIQTDFAYFEESCILGNKEYLNKEGFKFWKKPFTEGGYRIMVWMGIDCNISKGNRIVGGALYLSA